MDRDFIISEVRRTARANGGVALGRLRLETETGVKEHHWGKFWARYNDLVKEAGLKPNAIVEGFTEDQLCGFLVELARSLGKFPTHADIRVKKSSDPDFPNVRVFDRTLGTKNEKTAKVAAYCRANAGHEDVLAMCEAASTDVAPEPALASTDAKDGHVYLIKSGKFFKIGFSVHAGARERQLAIQLPEAVSTIHVIVTDDPMGIEAYWHRRFAKKRMNGEWFQLSREDIAAFKRRKFM